MSRLIDPKHPAVKSLVIYLEKAAEREARRMTGEPTARIRHERRKLDIEHKILAACERVADAVDQFEAAKYTAGEIRARREVAAAAARLRNVMRKKSGGCG